MKGALGISFMPVPIALIFGFIYLLLLLKFWRMADRIKEMKAQSEAQTKLLEKLVAYTIRREISDQEYKREVLMKIAFKAVANPLI